MEGFTEEKLPPEFGRGDYEPKDGPERLDVWRGMYLAALRGLAESVDGCGAMTRLPTLVLVLFGYLVGCAEAMNGEAAGRVSLECVKDAVLIDRPDERHRLPSDHAVEQRRSRPEVDVECLLCHGNRPRAHQAQVRSAQLVH